MASCSSAGPAFDNNVYFASGGAVASSEAASSASPAATATNDAAKLAALTELQNLESKLTSSVDSRGSSSSNKVGRKYSLKRLFSVGSNSSANRNSAKMRANSPAPKKMGSSSCVASSSSTAAVSSASAAAATAVSSVPSASSAVGLQQPQPMPIRINSCGGMTINNNNVRSISRSKSMTHNASVLQVPEKKKEEQEVINSTSKPRHSSSTSNELAENIIAHKRPVNEAKSLPVDCSVFAKTSSNDLHEMHLYQNSTAVVQDKPPPVPPARSHSTGACRYRTAPSSSSSSRQLPLLSRPHVVHRTCALASYSDHEKSQLAREVVIVYDGSCSASGQWARYLREAVRRHKENLVNGPNAELRVELQDVRELSSLAVQYQRLSDPVRSALVKQELVKTEELIAHATFQVLVMGAKFLEWIYQNPSLIVGKLFRSEAALCCLLGLANSDVKTEHRASLLTFANWKSLTITSDAADDVTTTTNSSDVTKNNGQLFKKQPSFTDLFLDAVASVLRSSRTSDCQGGGGYLMTDCRGSLGCGLNSSEASGLMYHHQQQPQPPQHPPPKLPPPPPPPPSPPSSSAPAACPAPVSNDQQSCRPQSLGSASAGDRDEVTFKDGNGHSNEATFKAGNGHRDEVTFSLWPRKLRPNEDTFLVVTSKPIIGNDVIVQVIARKKSLRQNSRRHSLAEDTAASNVATTVAASNAAAANLEADKTGICLKSQKMNGNVIRVQLEGATVASLMKNDFDGGANRISIELRVDGRPCVAAAAEDKAGGGPHTRDPPNDELWLMSAFDCLQEAVENTTVVAETLVHDGINCSSSSDLDRNMAKLVSEQVSVFKDLPPPSSRRASLTTGENDLESAATLFPTLLHWAAFHGLEMTAVTLLSHPGALEAVRMPNKNGENACALAENRGHRDLSKLLRSKLNLSTGKMLPHRYDYPTFPPLSSKRGSSPNKRTLSESRHHHPSYDVPRNSYDVPRNMENWYVVPPAPVPVRPTSQIVAVDDDDDKEEEEEGSYISMKPRSNSMISARCKNCSEGKSSSCSYADSRKKSCSLMAINSSSPSKNNDEKQPRQQRASSLNDDILREREKTNDGGGKMVVHRPQSREEVIKAFCNFSNQEILNLRDDYAMKKSFSQTFLADTAKDKTALDEGEEKEREIQTAASASGLNKESPSSSSWAGSLLKLSGRFSPVPGNSNNKRDSNSPKPKKFSTLPSKLPLVGKKK